VGFFFIIFIFKGVNNGDKYLFFKVVLSCLLGVQNVMEEIFYFLKLGLLAY
jgi:hypothetical protein